MPKTTKDRYRPVFCESAFYANHQDFFSGWKQQFKDLTSIEKIQAWTVALTLLRRPDDWFGGFRKSKIRPEELKHPLQLNDLQIENRFRIPAKLEGSLNLFDLLNQVYIKPLPDSCLRSLVFITDQSYPLQVIKGVPSPEELLAFQLNGTRVISFNEDFSSWPQTLYHGRDFLSFMIHDLIHADHFLASPHHRAGQMAFYQCVEMILADDHLIELLKRSDFKDAFEYIISDMNSHPVHLFKTLKACLQQVNENELRTSEVWDNWTQVWSRKDVRVFSALQKINTQLFCDKDAISLTSWCLTKGQKSL